MVLTIFDFITHILDFQPTRLYRNVATRFTLVCLFPCVGFFIPYAINQTYYIYPPKGLFRYLDTNYITHTDCGILHSICFIQLLISFYSLPFIYLRTFVAFVRCKHIVNHKRKNVKYFFIKLISFHTKNGQKPHKMGIFGT